MSIVGNIVPAARIEGSIRVPLKFENKYYVQVLYIEGTLDLETLQVSISGVAYDSVVSAFEAGYSVIAKLTIGEDEEVLIPLTQYTGASFEFITNVIIGEDLKTLHGTLYPDMQFAMTAVAINMPIASESQLGVMQVGDGLKSDRGLVSVNTTTQASEDNTLPMSAAGVYIELGNIKTILETI